jgi:prepilin-type N-terminal cleavage/methylation domain-containing protein/prepilin-type processing-associated H-X9-DG protein
MNSKLNIGEKSGNASAFTLLELVVVIAIIAMLAAVFLPALAATRPASEAFQCLENQRRFVLAWRLYSDDYNGALARNGGIGATAVSVNDSLINNGNWVHGIMGTAYGATPTSNTDPALIRAGAIFPYAKDVALYKCPADRKTVSVAGNQLPTTRSISMNVWLNPFSPWSAVYRIYRKQTELTNPAPVNLWVAIDDSPGTINDPTFVCDPSSSVWVDIPAAYHAGGSGMSFADGHAMIRKWSDPAVLQGISPLFTPTQQTPPTDLQWLQAHSTSPK